jgi:EmrB/QacA subfamily drug resistance transporter
MCAGMHAEPDEAEGLALSSRRGHWVLAVTILGTAVASVEATVVNVALPEIGRDLGSEVSGLQWVLNGYLLTLAGLILLGGSLGDRFGRRRVFTLGIVWFTAASALCAVAPSLELLVAARVLQGVGGALLTPGSLAIIEAVFLREDRPRAIGAWSALGGVAAALGPLLGGLLIDAVSWRAVFLLPIPLGLLVIVAAARHVPETRDPSSTGRIDVPGALLITAGLAGGTFALIQAAEGGALPAAVLGLAGLVGFVLVERRTAHPMLPLEIFSSRQFSSANALTFVVYAALGGVFFLLVAVLQVSLGYSGTAAGAAALPITVLMLLLSARAGALAQRIGPRIPLTVGPLLIAAGMLLLSRIGPGDTYVADVLPGLVVFGLGLAATVAPITATALAAADDRHAGLASGINNAVARTAQLIAVATLPAAAGLSGTEFSDPQALADGFRTAMTMSAAVAAGGAVLAFATIRDDVLDSVPAPEQHLTHCAVAGTPLRHATRA